ncbi:hypothetical protein C0993_002745 [Termitomyces sp. T159_Od127]|nr:hypothetical protein C0993_002745 [Termitomyces sp. T159_Od127]
MVPVLLVQFELVKLATDPCTPVQYDGLVAEAAKTAATSKGKQLVISTEEDESDYGQSSSKADEEEEEGKTLTQHFHCVQHNKKLTKKKVNKAQIGGEDMEAATG